MRTTILLFSFMLPLIALSQKTITGKVFDAINNKPLLSASVVANGKEGVIVSNADGSFTLRTSSDVRQITVSYVGYETRIVKIQDHSGEYFIGLQPALQQPDYGDGTRTCQEPNYNPRACRCDSGRYGK
jgi:hypothetical protein